MGDAEAGGALPGQISIENSGGAGEKVAADGVDLKANASDEGPVGNTAIEDEEMVGETQLDSEMPDAADNESGDGVDGAKTDSDVGAEKDGGDETDGRDTTAESGIEVADGTVENDNMYRRVRESALEAINAVRRCVVLVQKQHRGCRMCLALAAAGGLSLPEEQRVCLIM